MPCETVSPATDTPRPQTRSTAAVVRFRGGVVTAACAALFGLGLYLVPDASGYATHTQLGLPPCSFMVRHHIPCPTCGVTTAFSDAAHGRILTALKVQPFGLMLLAGVIAAMGVGLYELLIGRSLWHRLAKRPWWWAAGLILVMLAGWGWKLAVGYASGELPLR